MNQHMILMVNKTTDEHRLVDAVKSYEGRWGCLHVLKLASGEERTFDKDEWDVVDLTPTKGWNHTAIETGDANYAKVNAALNVIGFGKLSENAAEDQKVVYIGVPLVLDDEEEKLKHNHLLTLVVPMNRYKECSPDIWGNSSYITEVIRGMAEEMLITPDGLRKLEKVNFAYNWGDLLLNDLPLTACGLTLTDAAPKGAVAHMVPVSVPMEGTGAYLAPSDVEAEVIDANGEYVGEAYVDFSDYARVEFCDPPMVEEGASVSVRIKSNGTTYAVAQSEDFDGYFVAKLMASDKN